MVMGSRPSSGSTLMSLLGSLSLPLSLCPSLAHNLSFSLKINEYTLKNEWPEEALSSSVSLTSFTSDRYRKGRGEQGRPNHGLIWAASLSGGPRPFISAQRHQAADRRQL